mmetsp:Transcript_41229/g.114597  ORF Transcript_41229/g.114597 Transcript_41229/m.114597 type:complete len:305 (-) Transcript_41229:71-985(-)
MAQVKWRCGGKTGVFGKVDVEECLYKGLIGAVGAVPGTVFAHPFDVVKMRMQTHPLSTPTPWTGGIRAAVAAIGRDDGGQGRGWRPSAFFGGLVPAVQQKVVTRGPMFLTSEMCSQIVEASTGTSVTTSKFVGSFGSGFLTGGLASLCEYRKVLNSQRVGARGADSIMTIVRLAIVGGQAVSLARRMRTAGIRNGIFDSTFFGTQHMLSDLVPSGASYAFAAATAVTIDYSVDVVVKRMMLILPQFSVEPLWRSWLQLFYGHPSLLHAIASVHSGLSAKAVEFSVSHCRPARRAIPIVGNPGIQ